MKSSFHFLELYPVLEGFVKVLRENVVRVIQVSNGAGYLDYPVIGAG